MFFNYLITALRHFRKRKSYTFLNLLGLTIGLTASLLILLWVQHELSYDRQHRKADRIFRVNANFMTGGDVQSWSSSPAALAVFAEKNLSGTEQVARIFSTSEAELIRCRNQTFTGDRAAFVDSAFFTVFDFNWIQGNPQRPFPDPKSVVLTRSTAEKYFGSENPIGKVIQTKEEAEYVVSGILEDFPNNSSINYDLLLPMEVQSQRYQANDYWQSMETDWGNFGYQTYLLLPLNTPVEEIENQLTQLHLDNHPYYESNSPGFYYTIQSLTKVHLYAADGSEAGMQEVRLFALIALIILLIACINYVNLSTARATQRAKEVSLRKLIGADRKQLFGQLLMESALLFIVAAALALVTAHLLMPVYNTLTGKTLALETLILPVLTILGATFLFTLCTAGIYPALLLSTFQPIQFIKGKFTVGKSTISFRKALVVTQFTFPLCSLLAPSLSVIKCSTSEIRSWAMTGKMSSSSGCAACMIITRR